MSYSRYLWATVKTLKDEVLPELDSSDKRDQLINSLRIISRVAMSLDSGSDAARAAFENTLFPDDVRKAFAIATDVANPAENIVIDDHTQAGIREAARWLNETAWCGDTANTQIARELLQWEGRLRHQRDTRLAASEIAEGRQNAGGPDDALAIDGDKLQRYLREVLKAPTLRVREFRVLPGGRARTTALFALDGYPDWPEWLVLQRDTPVAVHDFPGVSAQFPLIAYARTAGMCLPRGFHLQPDRKYFGAPFMIVERMPGKPPSPGLHFFAPAPKAESFAFSLAEQMGRLHSLSPAPMKDILLNRSPENNDWASDLELWRKEWATSSHAPSMVVSAMLAWMQHHVGCVSHRQSLVHADLQQHNLLMEDNKVSAILDWEGSHIGHPGEDLGYVRPLVEQIVSWDRFMEVYVANGGASMTQEEVNYFTFRAYLWVMLMMMRARDYFENGTVDDIRFAELGAYLVPAFVNCVGKVLDGVLAREASTAC